MVTLLNLSTGDRSSNEPNWKDARVKLQESSYDVLHQLKNFSENVQASRISGSQVQSLKEQFIQSSSGH